MRKRVQEGLRETQAHCVTRVHVAGRISSPHCGKKCSPAGVRIPDPTGTARGPGQRPGGGQGPVGIVLPHRDVPEQVSTEGGRTLFTSTSGVPPRSHPAILEDGDTARR